MLKRKVLLLLFTLLLGSHLVGQAQRPWTFWYWMFGAVSDEGIRADLKAMKDVGIGGFYLMPIKDSTMGPQYNGNSDQLTPEWWKRIDTVYRIADSLQLEMGIHFCDGFALGGGPWITEEESMQKVSATSIHVSGGKNALKDFIPHANTIGVFAIRDKFEAYSIYYMNNPEHSSSVSWPTDGQLIEVAAHRLAD